MPPSEKACEIILKQFRQAFTVRAGVEKVWDFLMDPAHFEAISPKDLNETLIKATNSRLTAGTEVWLSTDIMVRRTWHASIIKSEPYELVDAISGDRLLKHWTHVHRLESVDGTTTMVVDEIKFECRYGVIGRILEAIIMSRLGPIFSHRKERMRELFDVQKI